MIRNMIHGKHDVYKYTLSYVFRTHTSSSDFRLINTLRSRSCQARNFRAYIQDCIREEGKEGAPSLVFAWNKPEPNSITRRGRTWGGCLRGRRRRRRFRSFLTTPAADEVSPVQHVRNDANDHRNQMPKETFFGNVRYMLLDIENSKWLNLKEVMMCTRTKYIYIRYRKNFELITL